MSNYTVIKADTAIYKDGEGILGCDMSGLQMTFGLYNGMEQMVM